MAPKKGPVRIKKTGDETPDRKEKQRFCKEARIGSASAYGFKDGQPDRQK